MYPPPQHPQDSNRDDVHKRMFPIALITRVFQLGKVIDDTRLWQRARPFLETIILH